MVTWVVELRGVRDGHSYVDGFREYDAVVMLHYLCTSGRCGGAVASS